MYVFLLEDLHCLKQVFSEAQNQNMTEFFGLKSELVAQSPSTIFFSSTVSWILYVI